MSIKALQLGVKDAPSITETLRTANMHLADSLTTAEMSATSMFSTKSNNGLNVSKPLHPLSTITDLSFRMN